MLEELLQELGITDETAVQKLTDAVTKLNQSEEIKFGLSTVRKLEVTA